MISNHCLCVVLKSLNLFTILRNLMAKQDMSELGFRTVDEAGTSPDKNNKLESPPNQPKDLKNSCLALL